MFIVFAVARCSPNTICLLALIFGCGNEFAQQGSSPPGAESAKPGKPSPRKPQSDQPPETVHRLESVAWDPIHCELTWVVSTGIRTGSDYTPSEKQTYKIAMDTAVMQTGSERRGFESQEAENVHLLMDVISRYAAESTIWWQNGEGERIGESGPVASRQSNDRGRRKQSLTPSSVPDVSPGERLHIP